MPSQRDQAQVTMDMWLFCTQMQTERFWGVIQGGVTKLESMSFTLPYASLSLPPWRASPLTPLGLPATPLMFSPSGPPHCKLSLVLSPQICGGFINHSSIPGVNYSSWCKIRACVLSCVWLSDPWTTAHQLLLSMGFSRQEYWCRLPFPSPGDF